MSEEVKDKMLEVAKILFKNNVPIEQAKFIGDFIETQNNKLQQKENIIKEVREDLHQVVKWCCENKHNENTIKRYLVVDYGTIVGKINEIRTKLDKENK